MTNETISPQPPCEFCGAKVQDRLVPLRRRNRAGRVASLCLPCLNALDEGWIGFPGGEGAEFDPWMVEANRCPYSGGFRDKPTKAREGSPS